MAVCSANEIYQVLNGDRCIAIHPFHEENLNASSYDVTLGRYFYRMKQLTPTITTLHGQWEGYHKATTVSELGIASPSGTGTEVGFLIGPGETVLAHTQEFFGATTPYATILTGYKGLTLNLVKVSSLWGDTNYVDRWPLVVTNVSNHNIPLICDSKIATVCFLRTTATNGGSIADLNQIVKSWKPSNILPSPATAVTAVPVEPAQPAPARKQYQQQIDEQHQQHQQRVATARTGTRGGKSLKLPEPHRDTKGNPVLPTALQSVETKPSSSAQNIPEEQLQYDAFKV